MDHIKQRLETVERSRILCLLSQLVHEPTIRARLYYDQSDSAGRMQETNEAIHRISGHSRDQTNSDEPFTTSRADSIGEALQLLTPAALDRLYEFTT